MTTHSTLWVIGALSLATLLVLGVGRSNGGSRRRGRNSDTGRLPVPIGVWVLAITSAIIGMQWAVCHFVADIRWQLVALGVPAFIAALGLTRLVVDSTGRRDKR
jgi:hypothetical protein